MYVGVYGTLRCGLGLHSALGASTFMGFFRPTRFDTIMVQTSAGYPAFVMPDVEYVDRLIRSNQHWQEEMHLSDAQRENIIDRTGWNGSSFDTPLLEVYRVTDTVGERLDVVEGVPHLYNRVAINIRPVDPFTHAAITTTAGWHRSLSTVRDAVGEENRPSDDVILGTNMIKRCQVYFMDQDTEWIDGAPIIWNGDFCNPYTREGVVYNIPGNRRAVARGPATADRRARPGAVHFDVSDVRLDEEVATYES